MVSVNEIISKKYVFETNKNLMIKERSISLTNRQNLKKTLKTILGLVMKLGDLIVRLIWKINFLKNIKFWMIN